MGGGHHEETQILSWFSQKVFEVEFMIFKKPYRRVEGYTYLIYHNRYNHVYIYIYICVFHIYVFTCICRHTYQLDAFAAGCSCQTWGDGATHWFSRVIAMAGTIPTWWCPHWCLMVGKKHGFVPSNRSPAVTLETFANTSQWYRFYRSPFFLLIPPFPRLSPVILHLSADPAGAQRASHGGGGGHRSGATQSPVRRPGGCAGSLES